MNLLLRQIEEAFGDAPRPPDEELLHEACSDDSDLKRLYGIRHWREVPDSAIETEWAALYFLSPAGFRHFLPAYLSYSVRYAESGAAAVGATLFALAPAPGDLLVFSLSKFSLFNNAQRSAVAAFLGAMAGFQDLYAEELRAAGEYWNL